MYVNGVRQEPGRDFEVEGRSLVFPARLAEEGQLGFWRWASMWLGIAGTYRKNETVDVVYEADGRRKVETGLELVAVRLRPRLTRRRAGCRTPPSSAAIVSA